MLESQGFEHLRIWPRGVDSTLFSPKRRDPGVRATWLSQREQPENKTVLLYVGRVSWEKNLHLLVKAYREMDHRACHLVVVGDGPALSEMQQELQDVPVTFTGYQSGEALATSFASADLFAFPSYTETFGQVVLEAMASGLPVVGLHAEGVRDLVSEGKNGLLAKMQDLSEQEQILVYRQNLQRLINDPQLRQSMSLAALEEAHKHTWYEAMEQMVHGYQEVLLKNQELIAA